MRGGSHATCARYASCSNAAERADRAGAPWGHTLTGLLSAACAIGILVLAWGDAGERPDVV